MEFELRNTHINFGIFFFILISAIAILARDPNDINNVYLFGIITYASVVAAFLLFYYVEDD